MNNGWTPERRAKQAEAIRRWKPWLGSTGPKSDQGKARASRNAYKGGHWQVLRRLREILSAAMRDQRIELGSVPGS